MKKKITFRITDPVVVAYFNYTKEQEAWLHDLETTDAPQGEGTLHDKVSGFCCLGRACIALSVPKMDQCKNNKDWRYGVLGDSSSNYLPKYITNQLLLKDHGGKFKYDIDVMHKDTQHTVNSLIDLNDEVRLTFKEIARLVRQYPSLVFNNNKDPE